MARKPRKIPEEFTKLIEDEEPYDEELEIRRELIGEYAVVLSDPYMLWRIVPALPGQKLPKELSGSYTSYTMATKIVDNYKKKEKASAKITGR